MDQDSIATKSNRSDSRESHEAIVEKTDEDSNYAGGSVRNDILSTPEEMNDGDEAQDENMGSIGVGGRGEERGSQEEGEKEQINDADVVEGTVKASEGDGGEEASGVTGTKSDACDIPGLSCVTRTLSRLSILGIGGENGEFLEYIQLVDEFKFTEGVQNPVLLRLTFEFQKLLGRTPIAKMHNLQLRNACEGIPVILIRPASLAEISRIVRAASSLNLYVRACGNLSSFESAIYVDEYTVLVQTTELSDSERMETFRFVRADHSHLYSVRVLAGVSVNDFLRFQEKQKFNLYTDVEDTKHTIVGSIVAGRHTIISTDPSKRLASLADLVVEIRIVDSNGNLITFRDDGTPEMTKRMKTVVTNLGVLGVVYDVALRISAYTTTVINYEYATMYAILKDPHKVLQRVTHRFGTQLLYIPFNSIEFKEGTGEPRIWRWNPEKDQVMIRIIDVPEKSDMPKYRQVIGIVPPEGPEFSFLDEPKTTPKVNEANFQSMRYFCREKTTQALTWSIHCYAELPYACNDLTFTIPTGDNGAELGQALRIVTECLRQTVLLDGNYSANICLRVSFTGASDVGLCPGKAGDEGTSTTFAHVRLTGIRKQEAPNSAWMHLSREVGRRIMAELPGAVPQWSTRWGNIEGINERFQKTFNRNFHRLRRVMEDVDRDGMFLTTRIRELLFPALEGYRERYLTKHTKVLSNVVSSGDFPITLIPVESYM